MRIGIISTRLNGTDGVLLEVEKWSRLLSQLGHDIYYCAGQLGGYAAGGTLIPLLFFHHPVIMTFIGNVHAIAAMPSFPS